MRLVRILSKGRTKGDTNSGVGRKRPRKRRSARKFGFHHCREGSNRGTHLDESFKRRTSGKRVLEKGGIRKGCTTEEEALRRRSREYLIEEEKTGGEEEVGGKELKRRCFSISQRGREDGRGTGNSMVWRRRSIEEEVKRIPDRGREDRRRGGGRWQGTQKTLFLNFAARKRRRQRNRELNGVEVV
ncbi:hypothetical protein L6452_03550 [Arctium lappa]|uniref:Uncharacterized protein n=1 Tax=Arctium lappa TaxID=4217 RepID=A0ACB9FMJ0_ARCLA|nr:hypothetical protein L6452_03550 [Arctium lappa]